MLSGESARTGRDYQRHYRSGFPHVLDPTRSFEREHSNRGWPMYMVVDGEGSVLLAQTSTLWKMPQVAILLKRLAPGKPRPEVTYAGTRYLATTAKTNGLAKRVLETAPVPVPGEDGILVTLHGCEKSMVVLRRGSAKDLPISQDGTDGYDASAERDGKGRLWVAYCALAPAGKVDVIVRRVDGEKLGESVNLTSSDDDAMSPRMTVDAKGRVWIAYYRWRRMRGVSRDKEVYVRRLDPDGWSEEIRLSPEDVPEYEDHTDPAIAPGPDGGVSVAWCWDLHRLEDPKYARYRAEFHAESPTVFGRRVTERGAGDLLFLGHAGMDGPPALMRASDGRLWCAWPTLIYGRTNRKALMTSVLAPGARDRAEQFPVEIDPADVDSPCLYEVDGHVRILWASCDESGRWSLKRSSFAAGRWSAPEVLFAVGNPREPSVGMDAKGRLRVAFTQDTTTGRRARTLPLNSN